MQRRDVAMSLLLMTDSEFSRLSPEKTFYKNYISLVRSQHQDLDQDAGDEDFLRSLFEEMRIHSGYLRGLRAYLGALLYRKPYELPLTPDFSLLPTPTIADIFSYLLETPSIFLKYGDAEKYSLYAEGLVKSVLDFVTENDQHPSAGIVLENYFLKANYIPVYFNEGNLLEIYKARGILLEKHLRSKGAKIDHVFEKRNPSIRIRIGVLAARFQPQTETFTTIPFFKDLDRNRFEIFLIALNRTGSDIEQYCQGASDHFVLCTGNLAENVQKIRDLDLDALIFSTNVSAVTNSIAAMACHRLARVQLTNFSSPVTTGLRHMDLYVSGNLTEYGDYRNYYNEKLELLDGTGFCFEYNATPLSPGEFYSRDAMKIPKDAIVFASGANMFKITAELRDCWAEVLSRVSNSILLLYPFGPAWTNSYPIERFLSALKESMRQRGVPDGRIRLMRGIKNRLGVKEVLKNADVYLDSFPYSGANSNVDPLELGIPVVAKCGKTMRNQQGAAMLIDLELPELSTCSRSEYVELASRLGNDPDFRFAMREKILRAMQKPPRFLDSQNYSRQISNLLLRVIEGNEQCLGPTPK
ncbi:hypothetical protein M5E06_31620 [Azospirillum sp. A1-3]|uniref:O-linked N-acetylglucosamine transferase family protein n=1 Tax=Azospirillum sp. A1-3 TaxID=185874 RepID=UPI0020770E84|nr:hypothetical protein [Azospirillum sp. A1-3]MCM8738661.1 hypothetical protein [Azospirillum sp. A1-3]